MAALSDPDGDDALLARIARGETAAIRQMVRAKLPRVLGLATRLVRDRAEAEDIAQEAFVRVWKHAGQWQPGRARFDTWLHTVTLNLCRDRLRKRVDAPAAALPDCADPAPTAERRLIDTDRDHAVAAAIHALPERQREAIVLAHYQGLSNPEVAAALATSVEAVESLLARARRTLRRTLTERNDD